MPSVPAEKTIASPKTLIIVDVQPTFCEGEELAIEVSNEITGRIADYIHKNAGY